nr:hypothetical protein [Prolixibacteraceae bacterium]
ITVGNFANATQVGGVPAPQEAGSAETFTLTGLNAATTYYFAIKTTDEALNVSGISNVLSVQTLETVTFPRIEITRDMVINEFGINDGRGDFTRLFDEQSHIMTEDPVNIPLTHWRVHPSCLTDTVGIIIDLGREYEIDRFFWFDGEERSFNGTDNELKGGELIVQTGTPFNWDVQVHEVLVNDNQWYSFTTPVATRFIRIVKLSTFDYSWSIYSGFKADAPLMEMVFYGSPIGDPVLPEVLPQHEPANLTFEQFVGANGWWYTDTDFYEAVGIVRAYQNWGQSASSSETTACNFKTEFDNQYGASLGGVFEVYPCLQGGIENGSHNRYITPGGNTRNPASYALHADHVFQWVARYGHNKNID